MRKHAITFAVIVIALVSLVGAARAQPLAKSEVVGLWGVIPSGERAVTSLVVGPGGLILGGTSGRNAHLFAFDLDSKKVFDLDIIAGRGGIHRSLAMDSKGNIYAGTCLLPEDWAAAKDYGGGHIYAFHPKDSALAFEREDLGIPVAGEGIYAMILDERHHLLFGMTFPKGHRFLYDLAQRQAKDLGEISGELPFETRKAVSQALVQDEAGNVYTSGKEGKIVKYDLHTGMVTAMDKVRLPAILGREPWASVDVFAKAPDGTIYGGTSDGYLFTFDPHTNVVLNLGKPIRQHNFQGLVFGKDGILYGVAGEEQGMPRAFSYDPATHSFDLGGIPTMGPGAPCNIGDMVLHPSGSIIAGEVSRIASLRIFREPGETATP